MTTARRLTCVRSWPIVASATLLVLVLLGAACVPGLLPSQLGPWANVVGGPGWRLIGVTRSSGADAYTVRAAGSEAELAQLWEGLGGQGPAPDVDLDAEMVVAFAHGIGSSCPELRLDGVMIAGGEVSSVVSDPLAPRACTDDLVGAVTFIVALDRAALPPGGFTLWLSESAKSYTQPLELSLPDGS